MQARSTAFLAAAAMLALSAPALAGQDQPLHLPPGGGDAPLGAPGAEASSHEAAAAATAAAAGPTWQDAPRSDSPRQGWEATPRPEMIHTEDRPHPSLPDGAPMRRSMGTDGIGHDGMALRPMPMDQMHRSGMHRDGMMHGGSPQFSYSPAQRAAWLDECRANQLPHERRSGGLLGGLFGAVVGGFAGNRIADGSRLAGTLIGGGVGAVAGAVIGSAIERRGDDEREARAFDFCEDYLSRYEAGAMAQPGYGAGYGYGHQVGDAMAVPMMMVAVPVTARRSVEREEIIEEWVEEVPPVRILRAPATTPVPVKRVPIKLVPAK